MRGSLHTTVLANLGQRRNVERLVSPANVGVSLASGPWGGSMSPMSPTRTNQYIDIITALLKKNSDLKDKANASFESANNGQPLTQPALYKAINNLAGQLGVPAAAFGDVGNDFIRFDFDA